MELQGLVGYVLFALQVAVLVAAVYAFVHAAMQRPDAFTAGSGHVRGAGHGRVRRTNPHRAFRHAAVEAW